MAFGKTAGGLILLGAAIASAAQFPVRHEHWRDHCDGLFTVDEKGVSFAGPKKHTWAWQYQDIQQLTLAPDSVSVMTYQGDKVIPGVKRNYRFTGNVPAAELYALLKDRLDQRFVAAIGQETALPSWTFPVKLSAGRKSSEGTLTIGGDGASYSTSGKDGSRTWRYADIDNISSSDPFELTITTFERGSLGDRKEFHFELKERISEAAYNAIWLQLQQKAGKIGTH